MPISDFCFQEDKADVLFPIPTLKTLAITSKTNIRRF